MSGPPVGELLESGTQASRPARWWGTVPATGRRLLAVLAVAVLLTAAGLWGRDLLAERELRQRVALTASVAVVSSSTSPPGGSVRWFLSVRNDGPRAVAVTSVTGGGGRLRLGTALATDVPVPPGGSADVPVSVRLTCAAGGTPDPLRADIAVRREDGEDARRRVEVGSAHLVDDVADTLCGVRPALRDHELSGPVLGTGPPG
ncbi:hypothetical protein [Blastococcus sp. PRF04-17]|uniref:hypothetical protein n=1 Tax=Blastococcus sp. PRF04-17 TaxID=2933797 RepID=UPI001FF2D72B|nr:hypothetical protein [Blastococcus sp. PRF04-17]UOY02896.1 hypothetical protein MVA48_05945 [Blastococcus sp. PRF04-17]